MKRLAPSLAAVLITAQFVGTAIAAPLNQNQLEAMRQTLIQGRMAQKNRVLARIRHLGDPVAFAMLKKLAASADPTHATAGIWATGIVRYPGSRTVIKRACRDPRRSIRRAAFEAVATGSVLSTKSARRLLQTALRDKDPYTRGVAVRGLASRAPKLLAAPLVHGRLDLKLVIVAALAASSDSVALRLLRRALSQGEPQVRYEIARRLYKRAPGPSQRAMLAVAQQRKRGPKIAALRWLGRHDRTPAGFAVLRRALRSKDAAIRRAAADALEDRKSNGGKRR